MEGLVSLVKATETTGGQRTPEERTGTVCSLSLEVLTDGPDSFNCSSTRRIAREHDIKVCEVAHAQAFIEIPDLICCSPSTLELAVTSVIA
jgi:hypothetical protein